MSLASMLMSSGTLKRPTISRDANQGVKQDPFRQIALNVSCDVQPASTSIVMLYAQRNVEVSTTIFFADNIPAEVNDIFVVTDDALKDHTFLVRGFRKQIFNRAQAPWAMDCVEIV